MHPTRTRHRLWRSLAVFALALATLAVAVTGALFTDTDAVGSNTFATGDVSLTTSPTSALVAMSGMAPGDSKKGAITVTNAGSLQLRYAVTSTTTEATLAGQLDLWIWDESVETDATPNSTCDATPATVGLTFLYNGGVLGTTAGANVVGDPTTGSQTGDRTLAASSSEVLCFYVELPSSTGNSFESLTTTATFTFQSEQTANNA